MWLPALGAYGTVQTVLQTAERYLPGSLAAPLPVLTVGVVLLVFVLLAKWTKRSHPTGTGRPRRTVG